MRALLWKLCYCTAANANSLEKNWEQIVVGLCNSHCVLHCGIRAMSLVIVYLWCKKLLKKWKKNTRRFTPNLQSQDDFPSFLSTEWLRLRKRVKCCPCFTGYARRLFQDFYQHQVCQQQTDSVEQSWEFSTFPSVFWVHCPSHPNYMHTH